MTLVEHVFSTGALPVAVLGLSVASFSFITLFAIIAVVALMLAVWWWRRRARRRRANGLGLTTKFDTSDAAGNALTDLDLNDILNVRSGPGPSSTSRPRMMSSSECYSAPVDVELAEMTPAVLLYEQQEKVAARPDLRVVTFDDI